MSFRQLVILALAIIIQKSLGQTSVMFGTVAEARYFYIESGFIVDRGNGIASFEGVLLYSAPGPLSSSGSLVCGRRSGTTLCPVRWRVSEGFLFASIVPHELVSSLPDYHAIVRLSFRDFLERIKGGHSELPSIPVKWPESGDEHPDIDVKWLLSRVESVQKQVRIAKAASFFDDALRIDDLRLLEEVETRLQLRATERDHAFHDLWIISRQEMLLFVLSKGVLEQWKIKFHQLPIDPSAPAVKICKTESQGVRVSWLGVNKPFRIARADSDMILVTDDGFIISHSPDLADPAKSKTRLLDEKVFVLLESEDASLVFSSDRYLVVPKTGKYELAWKPLSPELKATDIPVADPVRQVQFLKKLTESVMGK